MESPTCRPPTPPINAFPSLLRVVVVHKVTSPPRLRRRGRDATVTEMAEDGGRRGG